MDSKSSYRTLDSGSSWTRLYLEASLTLGEIVTSGIRRAWVVADPNGIMVGQANPSYVLTTKDAGNHWSRQFVANNIDRFWGMAAVEPRSVWIAGVGGAIFKTHDGGSSWARQASSTKRTLYSLSAANLMSACAVGARGTILVTIDGGNTWKKQFSKDKKDFVSVTMVQSK